MTSAIFRDRVAAVRAPSPGTAVSDPRGGGHHAWTPGGEMFACVGGVVGGVSVERPHIETAATPTGAEA